MRGLITNIKKASARCYDTSVPSSGRKKMPVLKEKFPPESCYLWGSPTSVAASLLELIK
jgi:hypothetical protein